MKTQTKRFKHVTANVLLDFPEITPGPQLSLQWWQTADCHQTWEEVLSLSVKAGLNSVSVQSNKSSKQMHDFNIFMLYVMYSLWIWFQDITHWLNWIWTEPSFVVIIYGLFSTFCFHLRLENSLKLLSHTDTWETGLTLTKGSSTVEYWQCWHNNSQVSIIPCANSDWFLGNTEWYVFPSTAAAVTCEYWETVDPEKQLVGLIIHSGGSCYSHHRGRGCNKMV